MPRNAGIYGVCAVCRTLSPVREGSLTGYLQGAEARAYCAEHQPPDVANFIRCKNCGEIKPVSQYYLTTRGGRNHVCKVCFSKRAKARNCR